MTSEESPETVEIKKFRAEQQQFYAIVGHCILRFQHVEDCLEDIFAAVLGGSRARADAIFASVRGIDRKIQIIGAAAVGLQRDSRRTGVFFDLESRSTCSTLGSVRFKFATRFARAIVDRPPQAQAGQV